MGKIDDSIRYILNRDGWICQKRRCFERATQVAHRIAKSKSNKIWVVEIARAIFSVEVKADLIIHHPFNMVASCSKIGHNDSFNVGFDPSQTTKLVIKIMNDLIDKGVVKLDG